MCIYAIFVETWIGNNICPVWSLKFNVIFQTCHCETTKQHGLCIFDIKNVCNVCNFVNIIITLGKIFLQWNKNVGKSRFWRQYNRTISPTHNVAYSSSGYSYTVTTSSIRPWSHIYLFQVCSWLSVSCVET